MKNTFGNSVTVTLFGESHGPMIGCTLDGLAPGISVFEERIAEALTRRRPTGGITTSRIEKDEFQIVSGVYKEKTTGTPLTILISNAAMHSADYENAKRLARPGHADYTAHTRYAGYEDPRGGGHFSGRITAALVAVGEIAKEALRLQGITVGTHIASIAGIADTLLPEDPLALRSTLEALSTLPFAVLDEAQGERMKAAILAAKEEGDSVGGVLETAITGMPRGVGEPFFDSVESRLSHMLFSIPAVKGVEFGDGFALCEMRGSQANDQMTAKNGIVRQLSNHMGGVYGGITSGAPILFRTAIKPTPSIFKPQKTIDIDNYTSAELSLHGRHDPCIVGRAAPVVDAVTALVLVDLLTEAFGEHYLSPTKNLFRLNSDGAIICD
ncbi:MAG: chorismate synthase [Ruminococcaceae bacterium]|nr:chorismate synthase [Oscillospiraceae bacterium]